MPIIRPQHARETWRPLKPWPEACVVQWGGDGVVLGKDGYRTAFFEAFPGDGAGGFIRGEGATVEEAEARAFAAYERELGCSRAGGHRWTRARRIGGFQGRLRKGHRVPRVSTYTNSGAFCLGCGAFQTVLQPIPELGAWRAPLSHGELEAIMSGLLRADAAREAREPERERAASAKWRRRLALRARLFGIELPDPDLPEHRPEPGRNPFREDAYGRACREAVVRFYVANRDRVAADGGDGIGAMFDALTRRRLESEAEELLRERACGT